MAASIQPLQNSITSSTFSASQAAEQALVDGTDFKSLISKMYLKSVGFVRDYADPNSTEITIEGYGTYSAEEKNTPGFMLLASTYMSNNQSAFDTVLNNLNYVYKTMPQSVEKLMGG